MPFLCSLHMINALFSIFLYIIYKTCWVIMVPCLDAPQIPKTDKVVKTVNPQGDCQEEEPFICHIHNYTEYNQQWNVRSAFNPSKCIHTWSSGQPALWRPGSNWRFGALLKGLNSVMVNSCQRRDSNPQPQVTSQTLYPLGHDSRYYILLKNIFFLLVKCWQPIV